MMLQQARRNYRIIGIIVFGLLFLAWGMRYNHVVTNPILRESLLLLRHIIHIALLIAWCFAVIMRVLNKTLRNYIVAVGILLILWFSARTCKWLFFPSGYFLNRLFWYIYYIPMILIPLLGRLIVDYLRKPTEFRSNHRWHLLYLPALVLIAIVLTNDSHSLVFTFPAGRELYSDIYSYGPVYFIIMLWIGILSVHFIAALIFGSTGKQNSRMSKIPLLFLLIAVGFYLLYSTNILRQADVTAVIGFMIVGILESAIATGLLPSNANYEMMFRQYTRSAWIVDKDYRIYYSSAYAGELPMELMEEAEDHPVEQGDDIIHNEAITGGHIIWKSDVSKMHRLLAHLEEINVRLNENHDLMRAEIALREQQISLEEQQRMHERITRGVEEELEQIGEFLDRGTENWRDALPCISVLGAYVKRYSNLVILSENNQAIDARELQLCINESLEKIRLFQVSTAFDCHAQGLLPADIACGIYAVFEEILEQTIDTVSAMFVKLEMQEDTICLQVNIGLKSPFAFVENTPKLDAFRLSGGLLTTQSEGMDFGVTCRISLQRQEVN